MGLLDQAEGSDEQAEDGTPPSVLGLAEAGLEDPQRKATAFERILDTISTPNYAVAGGVRAGIRGENPIVGAGRGIREHTTFGDVLREHGVEGPASSVGGFILDVALDPTTYLTLGSSTAVGAAAKGAKAGAKLARLSGSATRMAEAASELRRVRALGPEARAAVRAGGQRALVQFAGQPIIRGEKILQAAERGVEAIQKTSLGKSAREKFLVAPELRGLDRDVFMARKREVEAAARIAEREAVKTLRPIAGEITRLARAHGIGQRDAERALMQAAEKAIPRVGMTGVQSVARSVDDALAVFGTQAQLDLAPSVRKMVAELNTINASNLAREKAAGLPISDLLDADINYVFHAMRPEARAAFRKAGITPERSLIKMVPEGHASQRQRGFLGMTVPEINDLAEAGRLVIDDRPIPAIKGGIFVENPLLSTVQRTKASGRVATSAQMLRDWAREYGRIMPQGQNLAEQYRREGLEKITTSVRGLEEVWLPKDIAETFKAHERMVANPGPFTKIWDDANRTWKAWTLGIFPVYHTRNEVGDLWNAVVLGGMNPARLKDSVAILAGRGSFDVAGRTLTAQQVQELAARHGVTDTGIIGDVTNELATFRVASESGLDDVVRKLGDNGATRLGMKVGQWRENSTRLALFLDRLKKGDAPEMASLYVKQHLFDYTEFTDYERNLLRRLLPFYGFTRFNVPLQIQHLFRSPGKFAAIEKAREEAAGDQPLGVGEDAKLPRFLSSGLPIRMGKTKEGKPLFQRLEGQLPAADLSVLGPGEAMQRFTGLLSPGITLPIETATGVDLFRSDLARGKFEKQERFPGEQENLLGFPVPARAANVARTFRPISELERFNPGGVFGNENTGPFGVPRRFPDPDLMTRIANMVLTRQYAVDPEIEAYRTQREAQREISRLRFEYERAVSRGDSRNAEVLARKIQQLQEHPEEAR